MLSLAAGACDPTPTSRGTAAPPPSAAPLTVEPPVHPALVRRPASARGRHYTLLGPSAAARAEWAITLSRPSPQDAAVLAAVPATYTSPADAVEGLVMLDGRLVRAEAKPWEALLVIRAGAPAINRIDRGTIGEEVLAPLRDARASLLQGHLLVFAGSPRPFRASPALQRRALILGATGAVLAESVGRVELAAFANDLVALGASSAMNLDMGQWSEGWYRSSANSVISIGEDHRATHRQSNWLVIRERR